MPQAVHAAFERRVAPGLGLAGESDALARACHAMAVRFRAGGKLIVFGNGPAAADAEHVAVEFVHPVLAGKRALPAISLAGDPARLTALTRPEAYAAQVRLHAAPTDIALGFAQDDSCANVLRGLRAARELGLLTVALVAEGQSPPADHVLAVRSSDPRIVREVQVTAYHMLWELVHVFLDRLPGEALR